ncbi:GGDEF domain-containing protein [Blautia sp. Sow4_E7]|uniref:GGDEF domain-containing protein n=1 Tax=Blautia sp. Sow4_E7 TaxID=3438749 RepID=UPI003F92D26F
MNFSNLLRNTIPAQDFVGRYGGDEFMAVIYNASNEKINRINIKLDEEVKRFNKLNHSGDQLDINYAHGCAFSADYNQCTFMTLFNRADKNMYKDKMRSKNLNENNA